MKTFIPMLLLLLPCAAQAQGGNGWNRQECRATLNKLASDPHSEAFRSALVYEKPNACGAEGATMMARLLRQEIRSIAERGLLEPFVLQASSSRSPALLDAALAVANDRALPAAIRVGAVQIALGQHDVGYLLPRNLDVPVQPPFDRVCWFNLMPEYGYQSEQPLPGDYRDRLLRDMQALTADAQGPLAVRRAAHCVVYILTQVEEPEAS